MCFWLFKFYRGAIRLRVHHWVILDDKLLAKAFLLEGDLTGWLAVERVVWLQKQLSRLGFLKQALLISFLPILFVTFNLFKLVHNGLFRGADDGKSSRFLFQSLLVCHLPIFPRLRLLPG